MTKEQMRVLRERLLRHREDYCAGRTQNFADVCNDCWRAALAIGVLMAEDDFDDALAKIGRSASAAAASVAAAYNTVRDAANAPAHPASRDDILRRAAECVSGQREQDYGSPEDNFATIAQLWTAYSGYPVDAVDVAMMMALLKIARISSGHGSDDSFVDLAGYAACGGEIFAKRQIEDV